MRSHVRLGAPWIIAVLVLGLILVVPVSALALAPQGHWGSAGTGPGQFNTPIGVAIAGNGHVYIADPCKGAILYFSATGAYLGEWVTTNPTTGFDPQKVAIGPNGTVYASVGMAADGRVYVATFDLQGNRGPDIGSYGTGAGQFGSTDGIAVNPSTGNLWVADNSDNTMQEFSPSGVLLAGPWSFDAPIPSDNAYVAVSASGNVYVADYALNHVKYFSPSGTLLGTIDNAAHGGLANPDGLTFMPDGSLYIADFNHERLVHTTATGAYLNDFAAGTQSTPCLAGLASGNGYLYSVERGASPQVTYYITSTTNTPASSPWSAALLVLGGIGVAEAVRRKTRAA